MLNVISAIKYCRLIFLAGCRYFENKPRRLKGIIYKQKTGILDFKFKGTVTFEHLPYQITGDLFIVPNWAK